MSSALREGGAAAPPEEPSKAKFVKLLHQTFTTGQQSGKDVLKYHRSKKNVCLNRELQSPKSIKKVSLCWVMSLMRLITFCGLISLDVHRMQ